MGGTLATLIVKLNGDASGLKRELASVEGSAQKSGGVLKTALGTGLGFVGASVAMKGFGMATDFAGEALVGYNARMEQASIGFTTLLGSSEKAATFIKDLQNFAAKTPFDFPGLQHAANTMLAMGFNAKDILPTLTSVGDAVAALGQGSDAVDRATYALGQMRAAGRVNAQDMNQLTSIGIPAWQLLADSLGKTVAQTRDLSEKGLIPAQKGIDAIVKGIEKGNMGGMMAQQANTFNGAISTIQDTLMQLLSGALRPLFVELSKVVVGFSQWVQTPGAAAFFTTIGDAIGQIGQIVGEVFSSIQPLFAGAMDAATGFGDALAPLGDAFSNVGALFEEGIAVRLDSFMTNIMPPLQEAFNFLTGTILPSLGAAFLWISQNILPPVMDIMNTLATTIIPIVGAALSTIVNIVKDNWPTISAIATQVGNAVKLALGVVSTVIKAVAPVVQWLATNVFPMIGTAVGAVFKVVRGTFDAIGVVWNTALKVASTVVNAIASAWNGLISVFGVVGTAIKNVFRTAMNFLIGIVNAVIRAVNSIQVHIGRIGLDVPGVGFVGVGPFDWNGLQLRQLAYLASGGIITQPTLAMLGEGNKHEAVIPLDSPKAPSFFPTAGQQASVVNLNIENFSGSRDDVKDLMDEIAKRLRLAGINHPLAGTG